MFENIECCSVDRLRLSFQLSKLDVTDAPEGLRPLPNFYVTDAPEGLRPLPNFCRGGMRI